MANASAWAGLGVATESADRADAALRRINEKPSSIVLTRRVNNVNTQLAAQTMRFEYTNQQGNTEAKGGAGSSSVQQGILFGVRGHVSEADTDVQRDDRFSIDGVQLRVVSLIVQTGEVQAKCEVQS